MIDIQLHNVAISLASFLQLYLLLCWLLHRRSLLPIHQLLIWMMLETDNHSISTVQNNSITPLGDLLLLLLLVFLFLFLLIYLWMQVFIIGSSHNCIVVHFYSKLFEKIIEIGPGFRISSFPWKKQKRSASIHEAFQSFKLESIETNR